MMAITLWGRLTSSNVQKAVWALGELKLDYKHIPLGGRYGGNRLPDYLAMNPNGLVPTLRDGPLVIWESHAILRYLCAEYGSNTLFPPAPAERAPVDQWTDWTATTFQPARIRLFWFLVRTPAAEQDRVAIDKALADTNQSFDIMEKRLGEAPYLGGAHLTYADMAAGVAMYRWTTMRIDRPVRPNVEAWHARLLDRPAFVKAVNVDYEELRGRLTF
jgi:glutathione S-transferase